MRYDIIDHTGHLALVWWGVTVTGLSLPTQLAKKYHPDRNKGDADAAKQFTKIGEAYEVSQNHRSHTSTSAYFIPLWHWGMRNSGWVWVS